MWGHSPQGVLRFRTGWKLLFGEANRANFSAEENSSSFVRKGDCTSTKDLKVEGHTKLGLSYLMNPEIDARRNSQACRLSRDDWNVMNFVPNPGGNVPVKVPGCSGKNGCTVTGPVITPMNN